MALEEKIPPQDLDAEQSVLGAMMLSKDAISLAIGKVKPEYFYREAHANIFSAMVALYQKNEPVDLVTVSAELKKMNKLEEAGGRIYLTEITHYVPTASNVEKYAEIVTEKALLRKLIDAGSNIVGSAFEHSGDVDIVLEDAQRKILDISRERVNDDFVKLDKVLDIVFENIQSIYDNEEKILGVPTGFSDLDALTSGFQKSDLVILAARPGVGKTTLALNFAVHAAVEKKLPVAVFSLEMPREQLAMRLLSSEAKLDSKRLRTANLHEHEYKSLMMALGHLSEAPIYIDDTAGLSPMELRAKLRRLQTEADIKLIVIDYLQLMRSS
jgi:replicative DNA helicase